MTSSPKISIITVVFNAAKTLDKTINSVLSQVYENWEYIIVDGGSTDGTLDIIDTFSSPKIFWKSEPDKGIYDAMNKGILRASGEWIYFLGADDTFINSSALQEIFLDKSYEADFIYGNVYDKRLKRNYDGEFTYNKLLKKNICHQGIFFKRSLFNKIGNYETRYRLFADWEFNLRCFSNTELNREYLEVVVANYSEGGLSAENNDTLFFREVLFPHRLKNLHNKGLKSLRKIQVYDEWWRLIRSLRMDRNENLSDFSGEIYLPAIIQQMQAFQKAFPYRFLKMGIFSKAVMFSSYSFYLLTNQLP